ncbi:hypothetical protein Bca52824_060531 [Brassica carinata]|uniref:Uncharacterized protein n=1 Tax=Brassica carinata TaxID=52824 RepID=A0A8X7QXN5_BRACI|nr:hypothetical protein Bca52824_060531 [Brassica carinata]
MFLHHLNDELTINAPCRPKTLLDTRIEEPPQVLHLDAGGASGYRRRHLSSYVFLLFHYDLVFYCFLAKSFIHSHLFGASSSSDLAVERPDSPRKSSSHDIRGIPSLVYASLTDFSADSPSFAAVSPDTSLSLASHHYQEVTKALLLLGLAHGLHFSFIWAESVLKFTVSSWPCLCLKYYSFVESFGPFTENQVYFVATRLPFSFLSEMSKLCVEAYEVSLRNGTIRLCSSTSSLLQDGCALNVLSEGLPYYRREFVTSLVTISGLEASCALASLHGILTLITNIDVDNRGLLYVLCGICVKIASIYHAFTLWFAFVATFPLVILAVFSVVWNLYSIFGA